MTRDETVVHPAFAVSIEPTARNGCLGRSWILAGYATAVSLNRVRTTSSTISDEQLAQVRRKVGFMIGFPQVSPLLRKLTTAS